MPLPAGTPDAEGFGIEAVLVDSREPYEFDFDQGLDDLSIELPGMAAEDVEVRLKDGTLIEIRP